MEFWLPQNAWQGNEPARIELPDSWDVSWCPLPGDSMAPLTREEIRMRLEHPIGAPPLSQLARGKQRVCIVFDDITRGTPTQPMAQAVLDILLDSGAAPENIQFLCALGTHGAHSRQDHAAKLGEDIVSRYPVYNHNCYENNVSIGRTARGVEVCINREFLSCDLRIGLGAVTPHTMNGFGGGGKLLFPGLASIDTIAHNHATATEYLQSRHLNSSKMTGNLEMRGMREEMEEMTRMAGQFFKVDCLYNSRLELIDLYAGDPIEEYYAAVPAAQKVYGIPPITGVDVAVVNANGKASEATIATGFGAMAIRPGGDVVVVDLTRRGQATHYLFGAFGRETGGRMMGAMPARRPEVDRYIFWMPYPDHGADHWFGETEKQIFVDNWEQVSALLREKYPAGARAAVISDGTLAYYRED